MGEPHWREAISDKFTALLRNDTWELVPRCSNQNIVGCKWVFRIKHNSDRSVAQYKARLMAKDFHQRLGVDYHDTFSPVVKPTMICLIISSAFSQDWPIHQLDFNSAFLYAHLNGTVYMSQPPGFINGTRPTHVCRL